MYWDTVHTGLGPGPVSLADLGGLVAVPHLVARETGDGGLAPEAGALRPDLGLGRGRGRTAGERLAGEIRAVPSEDGQCLVISHLSLTRPRSCYGKDIYCEKILREIPGIRDCTYRRVMTSPDYPTGTDL